MSEYDYNVLGRAIIPEEKIVRFSENFSEEISGTFPDKQVNLEFSGGLCMFKVSNIGYEDVEAIADDLAIVLMHLGDLPGMIEYQSEDLSDEGFIYVGPEEDEYNNWVEWSDMAAQLENFIFSNRKADESLLRRMATIAVDLRAAYPERPVLQLEPVMVSRE